MIQIQIKSRKGASNGTKGISSLPHLPPETSPDLASFLCVLQTCLLLTWGRHATCTQVPLLHLSPCLSWRWLPSGHQGLSSVPLYCPGCTATQVCQPQGALVPEDLYGVSHQVGSRAIKPGGLSSQAEFRPGESAVQPLATVGTSPQWDLSQ